MFSGALGNLKRLLSLLINGSVINQGILDLMTSKIKHITLGLHCYKIWIVYKNDLVFLFSWW